MPDLIVIQWVFSWAGFDGETFSGALGLPSTAGNAAVRQRTRTKKMALMSLFMMARAVELDCV